jgi:hypothetical protein
MLTANSIGKGAESIKRYVLEESGDKEKAEGEGQDAAN